MTEGAEATQFACNGDGLRTRNTVGGDTTECVLDPTATLAVVNCGMEAAHLFGPGVLAGQHATRMKSPWHNKPPGH